MAEGQIGLTLHWDEEGRGPKLVTPRRSTRHLEGAARGGGPEEGPGPLSEGRGAEGVRWTGQSGRPMAVLSDAGA